MLPLIDKLAQQLMLPQIVNGALETLLNKLLNDTPHSRVYLKKLEDKVLCFRLQQPVLNFYFLFSAQHIDILTEYDGEVDCSVDISKKILQQLPLQTSLSDLINNKSLVINGDMKVLQNFSAMWEFLDKSPNTLLAPYMGDVMTYNVVKLFDSIMKKVKSGTQQGREAFTENLTEEWQLLAHPLAVDDFNQQVVNLTEKADQLFAKADKLLN